MQPLPVASSASLRAAATPLHPSRALASFRRSSQHLPSQSDPHPPTPAVPSRSPVPSLSQRHQQFLPDGATRMGFFIGDGAGVGKGRQISGIILDNVARGRTKNVWRAAFLPSRPLPPPPLSPSRALSIIKRTNLSPVRGPLSVRQVLHLHGPRQGRRARPPRPRLLLPSHRRLPGPGQGAAEHAHALRGRLMALAPRAARGPLASPRRAARAASRSFCGTRGHRSPTLATHLHPRRSCPRRARRGCSSPPTPPSPALRRAQMRAAALSRAPLRFPFPSPSPPSRLFRTSPPTFTLQLALRFEPAPVRTPLFEPSALAGQGPPRRPDRRVVRRRRLRGVPHLRRGAQGEERRDREGRVQHQGAAACAAAGAHSSPSASHRRVAAPGAGLSVCLSLRRPRLGSSSSCRPGRSCRPDPHPPNPYPPTHLHPPTHTHPHPAPTQVAATVIALQNRLPRARVVYCSATGVSEIANMAYMVRLGFWGEGTAFPDANAFLSSMKKRGLGAPARPRRPLPRPLSPPHRSRRRPPRRVPDALPCCGSTSPAGFLELLAMELKAEGK